MFVGREIIVHFYRVMFTQWPSKAIFSNKSGVAVDRVEQTGSHVVNSPDHHQVSRQERKSTNAPDVTNQCRLLVVYRTKLNAPGVNPMLLVNHLVNLGFIVVGHTAIGMRHHQYALDAEQVCGKHKRAQHVVGYSCASVTQDLGVARFHAHDGKWANARVHACHNGQATSCGAGEMRVLKRIRKSLISGEDVVKLGWLIAAWHLDHLSIENCLWAR